jgi:hypothetical protein
MKKTKPTPVPQTLQTQVKRVRKVQPVTDELYHWIKNGEQNVKSQY